jgi:hypothetical protein
MTHRQMVLRPIEMNSHSHQFKTSLLSLQKKSDAHVFLCLAAGRLSLFEFFDRRFSGSGMLGIDLIVDLLRSKFGDEILDLAFPCC